MTSASVLAAALTGFLAIGTPGAAAGPGEGDVATATTTLRAQHGLAALRVCADLTAVAQRWAGQMATTNTLAHNPNEEAQVLNWRATGENVGVGRTIDSIQSALVASPIHLDNLLSPRFTEVGYGTAVAADGRIYLDEVFRTPLTGSCPGPAAVTAAPAKTAPATPAGAPVSPTTASPPDAPAATEDPPPPAIPNVVIALQRLARPVVPPKDEDAIGLAFGFHQTFSQAVAP